ncbi:hypothetical protein CPLU01_05267 [Colletotrichum plurivorum]|uniref:Uncharacterized protein n=1 Tax=Colletotrichum plurivorum TaxID=2175906 RepID=A0A8H6KLQ0_9PEZI|nr:hypothetical protein CPLU01_05267 [Colletotrichum plurivorum]
MLCMDESVSRMWSEGRFALEPLDDDIDHLVDPSPDARDVNMAATGAGATARKIKIYGLRMRFHWLEPTTLSSATDRADFRLFDADGRPIETGHLIDVFSHEKDRVPDKHIVQLQWDVLRMHAFGAGPSVDSVSPASPPREDDDGEYDDGGYDSGRYDSEEYDDWDLEGLSDFEPDPDGEYIRQQLDLKRRRDYNLPPPPSP